MMNNNYFRLIADSVMSSKKSVDMENMCLFPVLCKKDGKEHFGDTFLDMDVTYHFGGHMTNSLGDERLASFEITPSMAERLENGFGITKEMIVKTAMDNISNLYGPLIMPCPFDPDVFDILSSAYQTYGASVVLSTGLLKVYARDKGCKKIILLPSSIDEMLLIQVKDDDDYLSDLPQYREMVWDINRTVLCPEDVLSDHVYIYDLETDKITIAA